jgi:hypothetical protein
MIDRETDEQDEDDTDRSDRGAGENRGNMPALAFFERAVGPTLN